jgi:hypothetical protein
LRPRSSSVIEVRGVIVGVMIHWKPNQKKRVASALRRHPRTSDRCAKAAQAILPVAREVDGEAHARVIEPVGAVYIQPKGLDVRWSHHVTVAVDAHHVDALTNPPGHDEVTYLEHFFDEPESHSIRPVAPDELRHL